jgi:hypothetical protein
VIEFVLGRIRLKRLVLLSLAVVLVGSACTSEKPLADDGGAEPLVSKDEPDAAFDKDRKGEPEPGLPANRVRAENEPRHEWYGAPSEYKEPERRTATQSKNRSEPCRGNAVLKIEGPKRPRDGFGYFTIEYGGMPCVRELYINGEPAVPEPAPCAKYRFQVGVYTLHIEGDITGKMTRPIRIREDRRHRFPVDWLKCLIPPCNVRSHDCPDLDEEMQRLWEANREVRERREKERRYQEARDRAIRRSQESAGE